MIIELNQKSSAYRRLICRRTCVFPDPAAFCCIPLRLPRRYGIGDLGAEARRFVDFLADAGQKLWQVLPLGPTGYGDSPYQCFSAWAGNPLLISLERLVEQGWLDASALENAPQFPEDRVEFERLDPVEDRLCSNGGEVWLADSRTFCEANQHWLDDFALFVALKAQSSGRRLDPVGAGRARSRSARRWPSGANNSARPIDSQKLLQFVLFRTMARAARICASARRPNHGRPADLCRAR